MLQLIAVVRCKWCKYIMFCSSNTDDNKSYLCHSRWQFDEDPEVLIIPWSHCIRLNLPGLPLNLVSNKIRSTFGQRCPLSPPSPCNFPLTIYIYINIKQNLKMNKENLILICSPSRLPEMSPKRHELKRRPERWSTSASKMCNLFAERMEQNDVGFWN